LGAENGFFNVSSCIHYNQQTKYSERRGAEARRKAKKAPSLSMKSVIVWMWQMKNGFFHSASRTRFMAGFAGVRLRCRSMCSSSRRDQFALSAVLCVFFSLRLCVEKIILERGGAEARRENKNTKSEI